MTKKTAEAMTLADIQAGHVVAVYIPRGRVEKFLAVKTVVKRTPKLIWIGNVNFPDKFKLDGNPQHRHGKGSNQRIRIPTDRDHKLQLAKEKARIEFDQDQTRRQQLRLTAEYSTAKNIGHMLMDAMDFLDEETYFAMAKEIGLDKLEAFEKLVEKATEKTRAEKR